MESFMFNGFQWMLNKRYRKASIDEKNITTKRKSVSWSWHVLFFASFRDLPIPWNTVDVRKRIIFSKSSGFFNFFNFQLKPSGKKKIQQSCWWRKVENLLTNSSKISVFVEFWIQVCNFYPSNIQRTKKCIPIWLNSWQFIGNRFHCIFFIKFFLPRQIDMYALYDLNSKKRNYMQNTWLNDYGRKQFSSCYTFVTLCTSAINRTATAHTSII